MRSQGYTLNLSQPIYRKQNFLQYDEAGYQVTQAEAAFGLAAQDLIVRTAQAYFDMLAAQDTLTLVGAQKAAISEQLAQAKRNFEVGTATITDTHEAQARYDLVVAQEIAAQNDLESKRRALQQLTGKEYAALAPLRSNVKLAAPNPNNMQDWVDIAQKQSYPVQIQEAVSEIANLEVKRNAAGHYPTLDLVASYGQTDQTATQFSPIGSTTTNSSIGLQLALPLYQGGAISSREREAAANYEKAKQDLENARRTAALATRQSYLGVINGIAQVGALEQALVSSQSALDSNKLGYEVGVRINIDVLNAQQQLFSTRRDLALARYNTITTQLKLKAAVGSLRVQDLEEVNLAPGALSSPGAGACSSLRTTSRWRPVAPRCAAHSRVPASPHLRAALGVPEQFSRHAHRLARAAGLQRRAGLERLPRRLGEVVHVRAEHHRRPERAGFDQVLPSQGPERAADQRHVAGGVVERHLPHRVAEIDALAGVRRLAQAAAREAQTARGEQRRHLVEALRVSRHDDQQAAVVRAQRVEQLRLLALARARQQQRLASAQRGPERAPFLDLGRVGLDVELQVAGYLDVRGAETAQPPRGAAALRAHRGKAAERGAREPAEAPVAARGFARHARVGQHHRRAVLLAGRQQIRPHLGLHHDPDARPEMREEPRHRPRQVVRQEGATDRLAVDLRHRGAAGGGGAGEQQFEVGKLALQRAHQRRGGAHLADRHRVHPDHPAAGRRRVMAEALAHPAAVDRLAPAAPPKPQQDQRQREPQQRTCRARASLRNRLQRGHDFGRRGRLARRAEVARPRAAVQAGEHRVGAAEDRPPPGRRAPPRGGPARYPPRPRRARRAAAAPGPRCPCAAAPARPPPCLPGARSARARRRCPRAGPSARRARRARAPARSSALSGHSLSARLVMVSSTA